MVLILLFGSDLNFITVTESKEYSSMELIFSDTLQISSGVPQRSIIIILRPLLFLFYINDFTQASKMFSMRLYADDTSLTGSGNNIDD